MMLLNLPGLIGMICLVVLVGIGIAVLVSKFNDRFPSKYERERLEAARVNNAIYQRNKHKK